MLRRHHYLNATLTQLQELLPSTDTRVHSRAQLKISEHPVEVTTAQQDHQQSASKRAPCRSTGHTAARMTYKQCKQEGSRYCLQWQELSVQQLFLDWMHKPEQWEAFIG